MKNIRSALILSLSFLLCSCDEPLTPPSAPLIQPFPTTPKKATLFLPLTGNTAQAAKAIQNGFFAAYFQDRDTNSAAPQISIQNSSDQDINSLYNQAVAKGSDLIVGPLMKDQVQVLKNRNDLKSEVVALNSTDNPGMNRQVLQFSLSPQQEAEQVATRIFNDGHPNALVITPAGTWGAGIAAAFAKQMNTLGGKVAGSLALNPQDNIAIALKLLLKVQENEKSSGKNGKSQTVVTLGRHDFDAVFLALPPSMARQVKPLLTYDGAGSIPVYATSMIYSGNINANLDNDLNGIVFCDMPWVFNPNHAKVLSRLYAFGVDAYYIATHLKDLTNGGKIEGQTGVLYFDGQQDLVRRQLTCGTFKNGFPTLG